MTDIVTKLWGFCHTLRHDGIDYGDYIEQLTYLLFLKMADERRIDLSHTEVKNGRGKVIDVDCSWPGLEVKSGSDLTDHSLTFFGRSASSTGFSVTSSPGLSRGSPIPSASKSWSASLMRPSGQGSTLT